MILPTEWQKHKSFVLLFGMKGALYLFCMAFLLLRLCSISPAPFFFVISPAPNYSFHFSLLFSSFFPFFLRRPSLTFFSFVFVFFFFFHTEGEMEEGDRESWRERTGSILRESRGRRRPWRVMARRRWSQGCVFPTFSGFFFFFFFEFSDLKLFVSYLSLCFRSLFLMLQQCRSHVCESFNPCQPIF